MTGKAECHQHRHVLQVDGIFDDFKEFAEINGKQQWPQTRSLWNAIRKLKTVTCKAI